MAIRATKIQSRAEEIANGITHGLGTALAVVALVLLIVYAVWYGDTWRVVAVSIYGATLVLLYLASTLYHSISRPRAKEALHLADHAAIYALIAGTYTPFLLVNMRGAWGWSMLAVIWGLAVTGITLTLLQIKRLQKAPVLIYLGMGWLMIVAIVPLVRSVARGGLAWLAAGGLLYSLGVIFYRWKGLRFNHAVWHVFVLAASACHFFAVLGYVVLAPAV